MVTTEKFVNVTKSTDLGSSYANEFFFWAGLVNEVCSYHAEAFEGFFFKERIDLK